MDDGIQLLYCLTGTSLMGNSGCFPRGKPAATESPYLAYVACRMFQCFKIHRTLTWITGSLTCAQMLINACDCTRGCTDTVRESAPKVAREKKIPCRTRESNLCQRRVGPMLYQLIYIPDLRNDAPRK